MTVGARGLMRALRGFVAKLATLRLYENVASALKEKGFVRLYQVSATVFIAA